jgi:hypothetical protein
MEQPRPGGTGLESAGKHFSVFQRKHFSVFHKQSE